MHVVSIQKRLNTWWPSLVSQASGFISTYSTNWYLMPVYNVTDTDAIVFYGPQYYGECNCATTENCYKKIDDEIPGYVVGCVSIESMLQLTLECHYNLSCLQLLYSRINSEYCEGKQSYTMRNLCSLYSDAENKTGIVSISPTNGESKNIESKNVEL
ncbi:unnamed protein product [Rotaria magnacalcarata]|uniref:Uncharacterized protein n=1 Tax=Rotaria magnacalcarata TaxID=392030 RepID=A0A816KWH7_9BILA|nr:unnamed protein product [Rotaria magnacalcarata]CAF1925300.1 unnamed protein product [Rotaria magnacalcarata]